MNRTTESFKEKWEEYLNSSKSFEEKTKMHENAEVERLGVRWFGCSVCGYNCYSRKWVKEHIQDMKDFAKCPAPYGQFGEYMHPDNKSHCFKCEHKKSCEIKKLKRDIAIMKIQSKYFLKDPNIRPLCGLGEYAKRYEERVKRLKELEEEKHG